MIISFGQTADRLLMKTVTRRNWSPRYAKSILNAWERQLLKNKELELATLGGQSGQGVAGGVAHWVTTGFHCQSLCGKKPGFRSDGWSSKGACTTPVCKHCDRIKTQEILEAYDRSPRNGGKCIGSLRLLCKPYQEALKDMPASDVALEGYPELSKDEFINKFFPNIEPTVLLWVIRFEFTPN
ncbi:MAG: hypothetical protein F6K41_18185 [Symploca sp. SIO3E6]|nr:hypothetical protein [Caldora sp. SIO3E6]